MANKEQLSTPIAVQEAPSTNAEPTRSDIDAVLAQTEAINGEAAQDNDKNKVSDQASAVVEAPPEARGSWQARLARLDEAGVIDAVRSDKNDKLYAFSGERKTDEKGRRRGTSFVGNKELSAIEDYSDVIQQHLGERAAQVEAEKLRVRNESLEQTVVDQEARIKDLEAQLNAKNVKSDTPEMAIVPANVVDSFLESQKNPESSEAAIIEVENPMVAIERRGGLFSKLKETVSAAQDQIRNVYYRVGTMFGYYRDKLASGQAFENAEALKGEKNKLKRRIIGGAAVAAVSIGGAIAIKKGIQAFEGFDLNAFLDNLVDTQDAYATELSGDETILDSPVEGEIGPDGEYYSVGGYDAETDPFFTDNKEGPYSFGPEITGDTLDIKLDNFLTNMSNSPTACSEYMFLTEWDGLPETVQIDGVAVNLDSQANIQAYIESLDSEQYDTVVNDYCNFIHDNVNIEEVSVSDVYESGYQYTDVDGNVHYSHQDYIGANDPDDRGLRLTYREDVYDAQGNLMHGAGDNILDTAAFVSEFGNDVDSGEAAVRLQCGGQPEAPKDEPPADSAIPPGNEEPPVPNPEPEPEPEPTPDPKETSPIQDEFTDKDPNETAVNNEPGNVNNPGGLTPELTGPGITNNPQPPIVAPPPAPPTETVTIPVNSGNVTAEVGPSNITPDNTYQSTPVTGGVPSYEEMRNTAVNTATDASGNVVNTGQQINVGGIRR